MYLLGIVLNMLAHYPHLKKFRFSHSSDKRDTRCNRLTEFTKFMVGGERSEGYAPEVGKALHEGIQTYWITENKDDAVFSMMKAFPYHLEQQYDPYRDRGIEACYATLDTMMGANALRNREIATIACLDGKTRPAIEVPFEIDFPDINIGGLPVSYIGLIDAILFNRMDSEYECVDVKTTRDQVTNPAVKYRFDKQCLPYGFVLQRMLGKDLNASYTVNYFHVYIDLQTPSAMLYPMVKSSGDVQDWLWGMFQKLNRIKLNAEQGKWDRNEESCVVFRKHKCAFFDYCGSNDPRAIQTMILNGEDPLKIQERTFEPWVKFELKVAT